MKALLLAPLLLTLSACGGLASRAPAPSRDAGVTALLAHLPGDYDNHAQRWQAEQAQQDLPPAAIRQRITPVAGADGQWDWALSMPTADGTQLEADWRYRLHHSVDEGWLLTPSRALADGGFAPLVPCAMHGGMRGDALQFSADSAACRGLLASLGTDAALLPLALAFDGTVLRVRTWADVARGEDAWQVAQPVRWYTAWVAINGGGPQARADSSDWHTSHELRIGNQGRAVPIPWRNGSPSGYSLRLETLEYTQRGMRVLQLSLVRDSDGRSVAYAWADPDSARIGLNLGWLQTGLVATP